MPDYDQKDPFDRARPQSALEQPIEKPARSGPTEVEKPVANSGQEDISEVPTRWQRIRKHPAFKPVLAITGLAAVGGVALLTIRSQEGLEQVNAVFAKVPEITEAAFQGVGEVASRKSPVEHAVSGYQRGQHYGPGGTEEKIVQISSYLRGGSA